MVVRLSSSRETSFTYLPSPSSTPLFLWGIAESSTSCNILESSWHHLPTLFTHWESLAWPFFLLEVALPSGIIGSAQKVVLNWVPLTVHLAATLSSAFHSASFSNKGDIFTSICYLSCCFSICSESRWGRQVLFIKPSSEAQPFTLNVPQRIGVMLPVFWITPLKFSIFLWLFFSTCHVFYLDVRTIWHPEMCQMGSN